MTTTVDQAEAFLDWLDRDVTLTPVQARIARTLGRHFGAWLPTVAIVRQVYRDTHVAELTPAEIAALRTHVWRLRRKLEPTDWRIENRHMWGLYRLVLGG